MNKEKIQNILKSYHLVTGMELSLLDSGYHTLISVGRDRESFCAYIHRSDLCFNICRVSDITNLDSASKIERGFLFTCPFGITEAIVPVIRNDKIIAYLFSTIGITNDQIKGATVPSNLDPMTLKDLKSRMSKCSAEQAQAHLALLGVIAEHIAGTHSIAVGKETVGGLIKEYVKQNLSDKISLSDIAWRLHCSTVTLTKSFKAEFGITIVEYITKKRMSLARELLLSTSEPVSSIAEEVGFSDTEYFSRLFKKLHGAPPSVWRANNSPKPADKSL